jgi:hypothetical protein
VVEVLAEAGVHFKLGASAGGILRPDKLVVYFGSRESLAQAAERLAQAIAGVEVQGVPFSAELGAGGLLSWGLDPPPNERSLSFQEPESWRFWVVRRLAAAMVAAGSGGGTGLSPAEFAVERLRHEGVDVEQWTPSGGIWKAA